MFGALDTQKQVFYARLDQALHSEGAAASAAAPAATDDLVAQLMAETLSFPPVAGISPQVVANRLASFCVDDMLFISAARTLSFLPVAGISP